MRYEVVRIQELGNEMLPCYEATVRQYPNFFERFFGARETEFKCVSDVGLDWYRLPYFSRIEFNSPLDKALIKIPQAKRTKVIQRLFEGIKELHTKTIVEETKIMN